MEEALTVLIILAITLSTACLLLMGLSTVTLVLWHLAPRMKSQLKLPRLENGKSGKLRSSDEETARRAS